MNDKLRLAAQAVVDESQLIVFEGCCNATMPAHYIDELREALFEPSAIDALIAEIDGLDAEGGYDRFYFESLKIIDKYRSKQ